MTQIGNIILATQAERVALSALDPIEVLKLAKEWSMRREFKRRDLPDTPNDLNVDHLETIARLAGFNGTAAVPAMASSSQFFTPPWMSDAAVTNSWIVDPNKITLGTGNGIASLAAEKGSIALTQPGGASMEPQLATTGWGRSTASCATFDGTAQHLIGDALATPVSGNDKPFSIIMSIQQEVPSGGGGPVFWGFGNTSDANSWHFLSQEQVGGIEEYRSRRASAGAFTTANSTFPYPTTASLAAEGFWRHVITLLFTGTTVTVRVDGIVSSINATAQNVVSFTLSKFTVGAFRGATTSGFMAMKLRRMIFGTSAFATGTYTPAENYMRQENRMVGSGKKGIVAIPPPTYSFPTTPDPAFGSFQRLGANWYTNYLVTPWGSWPANLQAPVCETMPAQSAVGPTLPPYTEFVPMLTSLAMVNDATNRAWAQANGTYLMTINEPDAAGTTTPAVSVASVLAVWPTIIALGMLTGAPAVAAGADQVTGWLHDFMTNVSAPHVDFIPVHHYTAAVNFGNPSSATTAILNLINNTAALYSKPIWLHEFNALGFTTHPWGTPTQAQMIAILQRLIPWLEASGNCARYSLYEIHNPMALDIGTSAAIGSVGNDGAFTSTGIGATYADLGRL